MKHGLVADCIHKGIHSLCTQCQSVCSRHGTQAALAVSWYTILAVLVKRPGHDSLLEEAEKIGTSHSHSLLLLLLYLRPSSDLPKRDCHPVLLSHLNHAHYHNTLLLPSVLQTSSGAAGKVDLPGWLILI